MTGIDDFRLEHDGVGILMVTTADGVQTPGVVPVRAFPLSAGDENIALVDRHGHEVLWIDSLDELPKDLQDTIRAALAQRDFMPAIQRIIDTSALVMPCTWRVMTERGETTFKMTSDEHLRRLGRHGVLVSDSHGITYLIKDRNALDRHSRRILEHFM